MDGRQFLVRGGGPAVPWEMHGVFVAVDFHTFGDAVVVVGVIGVTTRIASPHVPFGCPIDDPFSQHFASAAALGNTEGEDAVFKGVFHAGHGADQGQTVGRIGDRAVDDAADAG